jgi:peptide/nickel transport system permease protein
MFSFLARRVFIMIPTLLVTSLIIFAIIQAPEGDYVDTFLSELESRGQTDRADVIRKQYGLDLPFFQQYFKWVGNLLQGDMGSRSSTRSR